MLKFWMAVPAFLGMMILAGGPCLAAEETTGTTTAGRKHAPVEIDPSLAKDAVQALRIGTQWLEQQQQPAGCWSQPVFPAMTALAVSAILSTPDVRLNPGKPLPESVKKGLAFIAGNVQPDGGIYQPIKGVKGGGLPNYNTALSIMALAASNDSTYTQIIEKGRQWLIGSQYLGPGAFHGGMGYDAANQRAYADLSNTILALEALKKPRRQRRPGRRTSTGRRRLISSPTASTCARRTRPRGCATSRMSRAGLFTIRRRAMRARPKARTARANIRARTAA